ncbi:DUF4232 domain-containing protein [Streptomyces roseus]|uniref:DUF4232 domain-containing protein n=1 Tax=Streptomyces roseus TaxID=66430 RepID=A0A0J6XH93_9ACTN|nr:DUF4232 domain-containing protein [Streptomyces roseus]KMO93562.1 hypothetical protein ACS04_34165 [Streptomyces roseus]
MRVHKLTFAALAVAASLSLTACQNGDGGTEQGGPSSASTPSSASSPSSPSGGPSSGSADQGGGKDSAGKGTAGQGAAAGSGSGSGGSGTSGKCRTDELAITAVDSTIGGDAEGTVAVTLKNRGSRECAISGYAGVDLKTNSGSLSAKRTGQQTGPGVLKPGKSVSFGINYPLNTSGGSGVRVTGLVVTPPDETKSVTLEWPGAATLPVTEGGGSPVKVGPIGSAGQGE